MAEPGKVEVDTSELERDARSLAAGLDRQAKAVAAAQAAVVAARLRSAVPKRTGALAATVNVTSDTTGSTVHYGGSLPYASYIDKRSHATQTATAGCEVAFPAAMKAAAALEVGKI